MAPRSISGAFCKATLLLLALMPCTITGTELAINGYTADHRLPTEPGLTQSLWCVAQNQSWEEELLWLRGDEPLSLKDGNKVNTSNICVSPVSVEDNGVSFTCKLARDGSVQISVVLNVTFPPILSGEDTSSVEEDGDVALSCYTKANPMAKMAWYKDNGTLVLEQARHRLYQTTELFQLTIQKARKSDGGVYTCEAVSDLGERRRDFHLTVEDASYPFPLEAIITAAVVAFLTIAFAVVARRKRLIKCFRKGAPSTSNTAL